MLSFLARVSFLGHLLFMCIPCIVRVCVCFMLCVVIIRSRCSVVFIWLLLFVFDDWLRHVSRCVEYYVFVFIICVRRITFMIVCIVIMVSCFVCLRCVCLLSLISCSLIVLTSIIRVVVGSFFVSVFLSLVCSFAFVVFLPS